LRAKFNEAGAADPEDILFVLELLMGHPNTAAAINIIITLFR
jgi:hypothetical protein